MKEKFESILKDHGIYGEDVEEILYAVSEMLDYMADKTREEEPYATNTIDRIEAAAREVFDLTMEV